MSLDGIVAKLRGSPDFAKMVADNMKVEAKTPTAGELAKELKISSAEQIASLIKIPEPKIVHPDFKNTETLNYFSLLLFN